MKNRISLAVFLLLLHLCSWAQIGGDYNPTNPSDPGNPTQEYTLSLKATPSNGGSFNTTSTNIAGGKTYTLRAYPSTDFAFVAWLCNGDTLSRSSSYTYTMPYHDVEIIGVFTYSPSSPSDPNVISQKYTLTLKATPSEGGSFNTTSTKVSVGERYNLRAYPNTDFAFVAWLCEGDTLSKSASYDYNMPAHNVDITGVFTYRPSSPSDPQEQALKYQLSLTATPMNSGSFNISNERLAVGSNNSLRAYANTDFVFKHWIIGDSVLSTNPNIDFVMPSYNVQMVGVFEYNPASPANPNRNHWDKQTGEVIVDDFTPGNLSSAISSVISGNSSNDVQMIIVSGRITSNDFGIANNYQNCSLLDLSRVTGVTEVPSYAFDYTNLETIYLPATIEKIGYRAFAECTKLSSLTIYAMTPPTLESQVFQGVPDGLVVYVPAAAISQYQDIETWGKFTLLPIQEDIRSISISLPEGANAADYAQMWLELTNTKSGQRMHYVMTERQTYTFANIIRNTSWNVTLRNERGDIFGQIDNVEVKDEDVSVAFSSLSKPQSVVLSVLTPDGQDVTAQTQVTWTDAQGNYLAQGVSLTGLPAGYQATYRIVLSQELAMAYNTPQPIDYALTDGNNRITCQLTAIPQVKISGKVQDASTGLPLSGAVISASQTFGGKYSKTLTAKTDANGVFTLDIANVPTSVAFAASDYVSQTVNCDSLLTGAGEVTLPDISLKTITGATITLGFTYTSCDGETQNWYNDYQNVSYELFNVTKNKAVSQYNVQYPQIVLLEEIADGDVLRLTATSRTNAFMPVTATATIAEQKAETTFAVVELGKIQSSFTTTGNATVVGSLYDSAGKLVKTYDYSNASLTINDLADGNYTLVSMGNSRLFNTIYDLSQLPQTGLVEGTDYVLNAVEVKSGAVSQISIDEVPTLDESKLYYTGDNTSFTVNKPSIVAGNYLTLTGRIDFKPTYTTSVSNVQMIVDLPESCEFVENSVMVGNSTSSYTINGNQITIPMARYTDRVRFCIIPTLGGEYAPSAFAQFDFNGATMTQPIGDANYTVQDLFISVPSTIAKSSVTISGMAIGQSAVEIYDDGMLIGNTTSLANGTWITSCELNEPYNLSTHNIYAKVTTKAGLELISETKQVMYDVNMIVPEKVTMLYYNPEYVGQYNIVFDLINKTVSPKSYYFFPYKSYPNWWGSGTEPKDFTFVADLSNNDSTAVNGVTIRVYTDNGYWRNLEAQYNTSMNRWVAVSQFEEEEAPVGVDVIFDSQTKCLVDRKPFDEISYNFNQSKNEISILQGSISALGTELVQIEQNGLRTQEAIESIIESLNREDLTDEESNELVSQLSIIAGYAISPEDLEGNVPDMSNEELEEFVQNLVEECDSLLEKHDDGMDAYQSKLEELIANADLLAEDDFMIDIEESFSSIGGDTIIIENGDTVISVQRMDIETFDVPKIDSTQITILPLTDGNYVTIYFDNNNTYIVDSISGNVWAIKGISVDELFASESASTRARRARISSDIVDNLKKAGNTLEKVAARLSEIGSSLSKELKNNIEKLDRFIKDLEKESSELAQLSQAKAQRLAEVRQKLSTLKKKKVYRGYLQQQIDALEAESQALANDIKRLDKLKSNTQSRITKLKSSRMAKVALLSEVTDYVLLANNARKLITYIWKGISDYGKWSSFIDTILPCENDYQNAHSLKYMATDARDAYLREYGKAAGLSGLSTFIAGFMTFNKAAKGLKFVFKLGIGLLNDFLDNTSQSIFNNALNASKQKYAYYLEVKNGLKCKKDDDKCPRCGKNPCECKDKCPRCGNKPCTCPDKCPKCGKNPCVCPPPPNTTEVQHDPSGYVYEGVASNRLKGVIASCYYKEIVEDMYGDLHDNVVLWDAEEYAQENPLFTDEYGMYRWDVPKGLWQVKFEKDGYETTYSEWLPVPPPQLDVNIAMKQNRQPEVKATRAYEDAVEVEFDKYMLPELLNAENIMVMQNGTAVEGTVELLNEEVSYEGEAETFASKIRFNAAQPFTEQEITLLVNNRVKSYAGIRMQDNYQQTFTIEQEIKQIISDSVVTVGYGNTFALVVSVLPASASKGKTLTVKTSSPMILGVETEQVTIGNDGKAEISVSGELPGTAALTFSVEGTDKTAMTIANVEQVVIKTVATPKASIASGTVVEKGTAITLTCETEGATIYYTLDGSCPCDNTDARKAYDGTPIIINENVTIKAMAVAPDMYESEVAEFSYIVEGTGIDNVTVNGQIQIYPLPVHDKVNISAGGKAIKSVTISSMNGLVVASANKPATTVSLDVSRISTGIYIINVTTVDSTFSRKILKVE